MNILRSFAIAMAMYSKIPMPRVEWNEKNMKYAMCFFPVVGAVTGGISFLLGKLMLSHSCGKLLFSIVMTWIPLLITGGIHMDGFMDTMDALHSYGEREKKLEILKDPHSGAFAIIGICGYLMCSVALWSVVDTSMLPVIAMGYVLSRTLSGLSIVSFPAAKNSGLAKTFQDGAAKARVRVCMLIYLPVIAIGMIVWGQSMGAVAFAAAILVFVYYRWMSNKQFGGITGDLAGYFLQLCELGILAVAAVMGGL